MTFIYRFRQIIEWLGILIVMLIFIFPFIWMVTTAFKSLPETTIFPPNLIPNQLLWENFAKAWSSGPFFRYFLNSLIVSVGILALQLLTMVPAAYAFARYNFSGRGFFFGLTMVALMIPPQITFLPVFLEMSAMGFINTYIPLILPYAASAFGIFILRQSFLQVPDEIIEAARLDQASEWKIMWKIMVPMGRPVLITFGLFSFIYHWNDYFWPLVMTNDQNYRTLPIGIAMIKDAESGIAWNIVMAGNMILVIPILIIFFFAQRHIIKAFIYSGVK